MGSLRVDTSALRRRGAGFDAEADDYRAVAAADVLGVESDIEGFGEISAKLHDTYRSVHGLKQRAWDDQGAASASHAAKIADSADGYDRRESAGVQSLSATGLEAGLSGPAPRSSCEPTDREIHTAETNTYAGGFCGCGDFSCNGDPRNH